MAWRNTALPIRFGFVDANCLAPTIIYLFNLDSKLAGIVAGVCVVVFAFMEWKGYTPKISYLTLRSMLAGNIRPIRHVYILRYRNRLR